MRANRNSTSGLDVAGVSIANLGMRANRNMIMRLFNKAISIANLGMRPTATPLQSGVYHLRV